MVGSYREIEEYKKITSWYEKLDDKSPSELSEFIEKAQEKLKKISSTLSNTQLITNDQTRQKITQISLLPVSLPVSGGVMWKTEKTGREVTVYYDYVAASNFAGKDSEGKNPEDSRNDEVFLRF
ncbi:MAG: hypothetical protein ACKPEQ_39280, partial [Dolichospermum sp.]